MAGLESCLSPGLSRILTALGELSAAVWVTVADMNESKLSLHEAMEQVLREQEGQVASTQLLSEQIAKRELYRRKKDGRFAESGQIRRRALRFPHLFEMSDLNTVRLAR